MRISDWSSDVCSSDLVRPDVQAFLDYVNTARPAKHFELGPEKARTIMRDMRELADVPVGELAVEQDLHCPGPGGEIRLRLFAAREMREPGPAVVFFHGGGFRSEEHTSETPVTHANIVSRLLLEKHTKQLYTVNNV